MTVLVCVNTCYPFFPLKGKPISFEQGIVMVADTRLTFGSSQTVMQDDYVKIDWLAKNIGSGFCGYVDIGETALIEAGRVLGASEYLDPLQTAQLVSTKLVEVAKHWPPAYGQCTQVIVGGYDKDSHNFVLMSLHGNNHFNPTITKGLIAIGSGAKHWRSGTRLAQRIGNSYGGLSKKLSQSSSISLDDTARLICITIEKEIETARQLGGLNSVGGTAIGLVIGEQESYKASF
ncbi:hypothetical protein ACFLXX_03190 [Chloroflexota bacterium]